MSAEPESLLALDMGSAYAKATLVDRVGDSHRFVARGSAPQVQAVAPGGGSDSLADCLSDLENVTGRPLADGDGQPIEPERFGAGVDAVAGVTSVLKPLRVALCSVHDDASLHAAEGALRAIPSEITVRLGGAQVDARREGFARFAQSVRDETPHVFLLVGGGDQKPDRAVVAMVEAVAVAATLLRPEERPVLLYAGPLELRQAVLGAVGERLTVRMADNPAPDGKMMTIDSLCRELDVLHLTLLGDEAAELEGLWQRCSGRVASVSQAMLRAYSQRDVDVLAADVGASQTVLARTGPARVLVERDCGVGQGADPLLMRMGTPAFRRWVSVADDVDESLGAWALNRQARPWLRAASAPEREMELAFVREALGAALRSAVGAWPEKREYPEPLLPRVDMVVGSGAVLGRSHSVPQAALALIDGLQPAGVCRLALDRDNLGTSLGALAQLNPTAVLSVLERDGMLVLGTLVAPVGQARHGREVARVSLRVAGDEPVEVRLEAGQLVRLPLPAGVTGQAVVQPARGYDVGAGAGQGLEVEVEGGALGLILDGRGRPLEVPSGPTERVAALGRWLAALEAK